MILILDDHPLVQQGLASLVKKYCPEDEILCANSLNEAKSIAEKNNISRAFVDIHLGKENGFDFLSWLKQRDVKVKIFIITSSSRQSDFLKAQKLGVDAYLLKDAFLDEILYSLKVVEQGGKFYSSFLMERLNDATEDEKAIKDLTIREKEVLELLSQGLSNAEISEKLFISEGTVKKHVSSILSKLNLERRIEAVLFATRNSHIMLS